MGEMVWAQRNGLDGSGEKSEREKTPGRIGRKQDERDGQRPGVAESPGVFLGGLLVESLKA